MGKGHEKARQEGANCRAEGSHMGRNRDAYEGGVVGIILQEGGSKCR